MADEITQMMEEQRKELIAAGEIRADEKLSFNEIANRYTAYLLKNSRENLKNLGLIASEKPRVKPAAQNTTMPGDTPVTKKEKRPAESPVAVTAKPAEPKKRDSIDAKLQDQYQDALNKLMVPWEKVRECMTQNQNLHKDFLRTQNPVLAEEYSKLQAWLTQPVEESADETKLLEDAKKIGETFRKLAKKHHPSPENLQKSMDVLVTVLQKKNAEIENLYLEMEACAKEIESVFEKSGEGVNK